MKNYCIIIIILLTIWKRNYYYNYIIIILHIDSLNSSHLYLINFILISTIQVIIAHLSYLKERQFEPNQVFHLAATLRFAFPVFQNSADEVTKRNIHKSKYKHFTAEFRRILRHHYNTMDQFAIAHAMSIDMDTHDNITIHDYNNNDDGGLLLVRVGSDISILCRFSTT